MRNNYQWFFSKDDRLLLITLFILRPVESIVDISKINYWIKLFILESKWFLPIEILFPIFSSYQDYPNILCWVVKSSFREKKHKIIFYSTLPQICFIYSVFYEIQNTTCIWLRLLSSRRIHIPWLISNYIILIHSMRGFSVNIVLCGLTCPIPVCVP